VECASEVASTSCVPLLRGSQKWAKRIHKGTEGEGSAYILKWVTERERGQGRREPERKEMGLLELQPSKGKRRRRDPSDI
jgi:hypothetical protein